MVAAHSARLAKVDAIASALSDAVPDEVPVVVAWLSGELPQRQIGVGWAALRYVPGPAAAESLTVLAVDEAFTADRGSGRQGVHGRAEAACRGAVRRGHRGTSSTFLSGCCPVSCGRGRSTG